MALATVGGDVQERELRIVTREPELPQELEGSDEVEVSRQLHESRSRLSRDQVNIGSTNTMFAAVREHIIHAKPLFFVCPAIALALSQDVDPGPPASGWSVGQRRAALAERRAALGRFDDVFERKGLIRPSVLITS